jgi:hypothetical protein
MDRCGACTGNLKGYGLIRAVKKTLALNKTYWITCLIYQAITDYSNKKGTD